MRHDAFIFLEWRLEQENTSSLALIWSLVLVCRCSPSCLEEGGWRHWEREWKIVRTDAVPTCLDADSFCMYSCMHVFVSVYLSACLYVCIHICISACLHPCVYACLHWCHAICMYARLHLWMYAYEYPSVSQTSFKRLNVHLCTRHQEKVGILGIVQWAPENMCRSAFVVCCGVLQKHQE